MMFIFRWLTNRIEKRIFFPMAIAKVGLSNKEAQKEYNRRYAIGVKNE